VIPLPLACCAFSRSHEGISTVIFRVVAMWGILPYLIPVSYMAFETMVFPAPYGLTVNGVSLEPAAPQLLLSDAETEPTVVESLVLPGL
jgi:hypothetical protein